MKGKFQESGQLRKELWKHKEAAKNKELLKESHLKTLSKLRKDPTGVDNVTFIPCCGEDQCTRYLFSFDLRFLTCCVNYCCHLIESRCGRYVDGEPFDSWCGKRSCQGCEVLTKSMELFLHKCT